MFDPCPPETRQADRFEAGAMNRSYACRTQGWHEASASGTPSFGILDAEKRQPCRWGLRE
jgi:hypothetical protein